MELCECVWLFMCATYEKGLVNKWITFDVDKNTADVDKNTAIFGSKKKELKFYLKVWKSNS